MANEEDASLFLMLADSLQSLPFNLPLTDPYVLEVATITEDKLQAMEELEAKILKAQAEQQMRKDLAYQSSDSIGSSSSNELEESVSVEHKTRGKRRRRKKKPQQDSPLSSMIMTIETPGSAAAAVDSQSLIDAFLQSQETHTGDLYPFGSPPPPVLSTPSPSVNHQDATTSSTVNTSTSPTPSPPPPISTIVTTHTAVEIAANNNTPPLLPPLPTMPPVVPVVVAPVRAPVVPVAPVSAGGPPPLPTLPTDSQALLNASIPTPPVAHINNKEPKRTYSLQARKVPEVSTPSAPGHEIGSNNTTVAQQTSVPAPVTEAERLVLDLLRSESNSPPVIASPVVLPMGSGVVMNDKIRSDLEVPSFSARSDFIGSMISPSPYLSSMAIPSLSASLPSHNAGHLHARQQDEEVLAPSPLIGALIGQSVASSVATPSPDYIASEVQAPGKERKDEDEEEEERPMRPVEAGAASAAMAVPSGRVMAQSMEPGLSASMDISRGLGMESIASLVGSMEHIDMSALLSKALEEQYTEAEQHYQAESNLIVASSSSPTPTNTDSYPIGTTLSDSGGVASDSESSEGLPECVSDEEEVSFWVPDLPNEPELPASPTTDTILTEYNTSLLNDNNNNNKNSNNNMTPTDRQVETTSTEAENKATNIDLSDWVNIAGSDDEEDENVESEFISLGGEPSSAQGTPTEQRDDTYKLIVTVPVRPKVTGNIECFGCKKTISVSAFARQSRYCEYFGQYFCRDCHTNQESIIPARVLQSWDFGVYKISNMARHRLRFSANESVMVPQEIYSLSKRMNVAREYRSILFQMAPYITTCRDKDTLAKFVENDVHVFVDENLYTLRDLVRTRENLYLPFLTNLVNTYNKHVSSCVICQNKGHICELCTNKTVLFPFNNNITLCPGCHKIFHQECYYGTCPRCQRKADILRAKGLLPAIQKPPM